MQDLKLFPQSKINGSIKPPGSKSITNRLLLLSSLCPQKILVTNHLVSDDSGFMVQALKDLGLSINNQTESIVIEGGIHKYSKKVSLFLGNAGTAFRPLCAVLSILGGDYILDGVERMHERPIKDLVDALNQIGAQITYLKNDGFPPLKIGSFNDTTIQEVVVKGNTSSQFLSSLLMALPILKRDVQVNIDGELISKPYIDITLNLLATFNIKFTNHNYNRFDYRYSEKNYYFAKNPVISVEPDASSASYFFAAAAISGKIKIMDLTKNSIQGDIYFLDCIEKMGAKVKYLDDSITVSQADQLSGGYFDCISIPDAAMTLAILGLFCSSPLTLDNIASWKVKETDRIHAMKNELEKFGAKVDATDNSITINPPKKLNNNIRVKTYEDHRIAMCFALTCLGGITTIIEDPQCVNKTYPNFFRDFTGLLS